MVALRYYPPPDGSDWGYLVMAIVIVPAAILVRRGPIAALALLLGCALAESLAPRAWRIAFLEPVSPVLPTQPVLLVLAIGAAVGYIAATRQRQTSVTAALVAWAVAVTCLVIRLKVVHGTTLYTSPELVVTLLTAIAWLAGHSVRQARQHASALRTQDQAQAVTAERLRIARELHDMVAHSIGIIAIQAGVGSRVIGSKPEAARRSLAVIEETSRQTLSGLRRMLVALRRDDPGGAAAALAPAAGLAELDRLAEASANAGVRIDLHRAGERRQLPPDVDMSAFRIIQEAVTNVARHAGTGQCSVSVDDRGSELHIEVTDDGRGCTAPGNGFGIAGMRERAGLLHGQFTAGNRPDGGFRVAACLPVPTAPHPPPAQPAQPAQPAPPAPSSEAPAPAGAR